MEIVSRSDNLIEQLSMFLNRDNKSMKLTMYKKEETKLRRYIDQQNIQLEIETEEISSSKVKVTLTKK